MTFAEFDYICHAYQPSERSVIIADFETLRGKFLTEDVCIKFLRKAELYIKRYEDIRIKRMIQQLRLALTISKHGAGGKTRQLAQELWLELEKCDTWYLNDFRKLNLVLPIIPLDQLPEFVAKMLSSLDKYKDFKDVGVSQFAFLYNLSTILLRNEEYKHCTSVMEQVYAIAQDSMRIDYLSIASVRMGIMTGDEKQIKKWLSILQAVEMNDLLKQLEEDVEIFFGVHTKMRGYEN